MVKRKRMKRKTKPSIERYIDSKGKKRWRHTSKKGAIYEKRKATK